MAAEQETGKRQPDANSQILVNLQLKTGSQMPIRFEAAIENNRSISNWQKAASCQFVSPAELASGNWQPDANSI